jgi:hypothetical protein
MVEERIIAIAKEVYDYLKRNCIGVQTCTADAVEAVFPGVITLDSEKDLWAIHDALYHLVSKERKYVLDAGEETDCYIGQAYVCSFQLRPRSAKSPAWKIRIPYFNTGEEYFNWIADLPEFGIPEAYLRYFRGLYQATIHHGYEHPIKKEKMIKALKRSQRTGEMIDIAPDKEFLLGGAREGQCDGWTYHIEFVSMRDYFSSDYDERKLIGEDLPPKEEWVDALVNHPNEMD